MSSFEHDDVDHAIAALQAVKLVRDYYASANPASERIQEIAQMLAARDSGMGTHGGLRANVADAICKAYLNRPLKP